MQTIFTPLKNRPCVTPCSVDGFLLIFNRYFISVYNMWNLAVGVSTETQNDIYVLFARSY